jgi:hypothetical protein
MAAAATAQRNTIAHAEGSAKPTHVAKGAGVTRPREPDRQSDLAARRTGQELTERLQVGNGGGVEPLAPADELIAKTADMRDRSADGEVGPNFRKTCRTS